ncbi:VOC family protein [Enterovirga rhinocerotis]|uniref:Catechol 2,3-dioxygenase-like lactoylglutathione lyase family enzyme n=1 Tax=Enterovirga rhinocerotis TaxID=1339210 RepID=A0A4R7BPL8_9HYPH|nr:VOC family protein [Enterovirga rhinocerotis]TDR87093.1 catechol 2,3-dioxygenase-like lactoylglutathione lyase family enzyme [Enterovirga rhinocerotis]
MPSFEPVFDHIHLRSLDPDKAATFYVDRLGAKVADRIETDKMLRVAIRIGTLDIFIDRVPDGTTPAAARPHRGLEHFGLKVDDLDTAVADLKAHGVEFTMEPVEFRPGLRISFIRGPDDVSIEILERKTV